MSKRTTPSLIERIAEKVGIIPNLHEDNGDDLERLMPEGDLTTFPPPDKWDDWEEYESTGWPVKKKRNLYRLFRLLALIVNLHVDLLRLLIRKISVSGNSKEIHIIQASRGRNCAKGPATINQLTDPDQILYPMKRKGKRGEGQWERVSWDEALDDIAERMSKALQEDTK